MLFHPNRIRDCACVVAHPMPHAAGPTQPTPYSTIHCHCRLPLPLLPIPTCTHALSAVIVTARRRQRHSQKRRRSPCTGMWRAPRVGCTAGSSDRPPFPWAARPASEAIVVVMHLAHHARRFATRAGNHCQLNPHSHGSLDVAR